MESGPITSWQIDGETMGIVTDFIFSPKSLWMVTAAMKLRCLFFGRKTMTNLDSILKSRDITLQADSLPAEQLGKHILSKQPNKN